MEPEGNDTARLERLQAEHERLKKNPKIVMLGEGPGTVNVSRTFAHQLTDLTPTQRRLALAKACAQPWRDDPEAMPDCYREGLDHAVYEAREEHLGCCTPAFDPDSLFETEPEPISPYLLRQLAEMTPALRRLSLIFVISWSWDGHPEELRAAALAKGIEPREPEDYPEWVTRDFEYIAQEMHEERKANGLPSRTTEDASTPQDGAKALAAELNRRIED